LPLSVSNIEKAGKNGQKVKRSAFTYLRFFNIENVAKKDRKLRDRSLIMGGRRWVRKGGGFNYFA
jgi:hypothetical protein